MKKISRSMMTLAISATCTLVPTSVFAADGTPDPSTAETPVTAELELKNPDPITPPIDPVDPNQPGVDPTPITGHFGIAYIPKPLITTSKLENTGQQTITLKNTIGRTRCDVGVRDTLRKKNKWALSAQLIWSGANASFMDGTTITGENGQVTQNTDGVLGNIQNAEVSTSASSLSISNTPTNVLETVDGKQTNGIYNYGFENPSLVIPATEKVPAGSYSGNITWNLTATPVTP